MKLKRDPTKVESCTQPSKQHNQTVLDHIPESTQTIIPMTPTKGRKDQRSQIIDKKINPWKQVK